MFKGYAQPISTVEILIVRAENIADDIFRSIPGGLP